MFQKYWLRKKLCKLVPVKRLLICHSKHSTHTHTHINSGLYCFFIPIVLSLIIGRKTNNLFDFKILI